MQIQWYPGHMAKARRNLSADLGLVDVVLEVADARVPSSSRNPELLAFAAGRPRLLLLNKADLADQAATRAWQAALRRQGETVESAGARGDPRLQRVAETLVRLGRPRLKYRRPVRAMVVGIPNVGKSTVLNRLVGRASARTGDLPGVTRGKQWVRLREDLEVLDTPGLLWPQLSTPEVGFRLAVTGALPEHILPLEELARELLHWLVRAAPERLAERYSLPVGEAPDLAGLARRRGCLLPGGEPDLGKAAGLLLKDFRLGRLGRFTLDPPPAGGEA